jgi:ferrous iron transport protein A
MNAKKLSKLSELGSGERGRVRAIELTGMARRRLLDFGFVPDTEIEVAFRSPMGDPTSYRIKDSMIALRREESDCIVVERI